MSLGEPGGGELCPPGIRAKDMPGAFQKGIQPKNGNRRPSPPAPARLSRLPREGPLENQRQTLQTVTPHSPFSQGPGGNHYPCSALITMFPSSSVSLKQLHPSGRELGRCQEPGTGSAALGESSGPASPACVLQWPNLQGCCFKDLVQTRPGSPPCPPTAPRHVPSPWLSVLGCSAGEVGWAGGKVTNTRPGGVGAGYAT